MPAAAASAQEGALPVPTPVITKKLIIIKKRAAGKPVPAAHTDPVSDRKWLYSYNIEKDRLLTFLQKAQ